MKAKNKLVIRRIRIKGEGENVILWLEKDISKVEDTFFQWILENISENLTIQRMAKFIMAEFYEMGFMKGIFVLVKVDEMYNILKSASHSLLVEIWRWNWMIKVSPGICPWMSIGLLCHYFNKGHSSSCKRYSCRENGGYCNIGDTGEG